MAGLRASVVTALLVGTTTVVAWPAIGRADDPTTDAADGSTRDVVVAVEADAQRPNGFALDALRVPRDDIKPGGPPRDGIRSVTAPRFVPVPEATWVRGDTPVIGVSVDGVDRAYPVHVLEWHQVVNDRVGGSPLVVTYDPITDLAGAWQVPEGVAVADFGVSGLLDRDGFLLFDRETDSLWSSATGHAISGRHAGARLDAVRVRVETLGRWLERHPSTEVLALPDRRRIDYRHSPYSAYWTSESVPLAVRARDDRFHPKEVVLGVEVAGRTRAYIGSIVSRAGGRVVDDLAGRRIRVAYDGESGTFAYEVPDDVTPRSAYWFEWKSLHPDTEIWGEELGSARPSHRPGRDAGSGEASAGRGD